MSNIMMISLVFTLDHTNPAWDEDKARLQCYDSQAQAWPYCVLTAINVPHS
jgi:hypothetical protein